MERFFAGPGYLPAADDSGYRETHVENRAFARWVERKVAPYRKAGHAIVTLSLEAPGMPPGDAPLILPPPMRLARLLGGRNGYRSVWKGVGRQDC